MSAAGLVPFKLGRGARRTYEFLLNEGGWWTVREVARALDLSEPTGVQKQLRALRLHQHVACKGEGQTGDPHRYGVTAACVPVAGVSLRRSEGA